VDLGLAGLHDSCNLEVLSSLTYSVLPPRLLVFISPPCALPPPCTNFPSLLRFPLRTMPPPQSWTASSTTCTHRQSIDSTPPTSAFSHISSHAHAHTQPSVRLNEARYPDNHQPVSSQSQADKTPSYPGSGTPEDPYIVDWDDNDPENPYNWTKARRWFITAQVRS
jgi:hypothetical protein